MCLLTGCLSRPHLDTQSFVFSPPLHSASGVVANGRVLGIRSLQVAAPFEGRGFVYRTGPFSYGRDPYAEFMVLPAHGMVCPICSWWRAAGGFKAVVDTGSAFKPDTLVEIQVSQLYGDFRPSEKPAACLTMHFIFFDAPAGVPGKVILEREYSRAIPLPARNAPALIEGWNQALSQILDAAMMDFANVHL